MAGNHDLTLDGVWWEEREGDWRKKGFGGGGDGEGKGEVERCREVWGGEEARRRGVVYLEEGVREVEWGEGRSLRVSSGRFFYVVLFRCLVLFGGSSAGFVSLG